MQECCNLFQIWQLSSDLVLVLQNLLYRELHRSTLPTQLHLVSEIQQPRGGPHKVDGQAQGLDRRQLRRLSTRDPLRFQDTGRGHGKRLQVHPPMCSSDQHLQREDLPVPVVLDDPGWICQCSQLHRLVTPGSSRGRPEEVRSESHQLGVGVAEEVD